MICWDVDQDDSGEGTSQTSHSTAEPVAAVLGDRRRHRSDESGTVHTDRCEK